jgi:two-component system, NarL family, sensor histidine kinase UhpB
VFSNFNWSQLGKLIAVILVVQAIYWYGIDQPLMRAKPSDAPPMLEMLPAEIAQLKTPTLAEAATATYKPVELLPAGTMWTHCCDTAMFAVRIPFQVDAIPTNGLGIISDLQVDNYILAVNGSILVARGRMQPGNGSFHGQIKYLTRIPSGVIKTGRNELTYITLRDGFPYTDIIAPRIAEYDALDRHTAKRLYIVGDHLMVSGVLLGLLGLLAAIMVFRSDDWRFAMWLSALCAGFASYSIYSLWLDPPVDGWGRMLAFFMIYMFIPTALLCFMDSWTKKPIRWLQPAALAGYAAIVTIIAWHIYRVPMPDGFDTPATLWIWFLMIAALAFVARLLWHFATQAEERLIESALLTVFATALVLDAVSNWFPQFGVREGNMLNSSVFLIVAMMAAFLARNFRLFQSQGALNSLLQVKVDQREAELVEAAKREQVLVRQQAHDDERRRIMRDLHDGLGSQLMSMMLSARLGEAEPSKVAEGLQGVIDEMRLMVDSMDSVGESLEAALATFRTRVEPRVQQAGFALLWQQDETISLPDFGPRDVLQVFRVLQEAVTNALKHSGGSEIAISVEQLDDDRVLIQVADNGEGGAFDGKAAGRGLSNMRSRAKAVHGDCTISASPSGGTQVRLTLPQKQLAAA